MIVDIDTIASAGGASTDEKRGARAAQLIWDDDPQIENISDPRTSGFASAVVAELARLLQRSGGVVRKVMQNATEAAADLNVSKFQGLVEIIQNADDLQATEVRFAVRQGPRGQQLLIVHDGLPVTCHHVLGMALPYLTTKTNRVDQRGRFGIGLKTLTRIADSITVHSAPYHFSLHRVSLTEAGAEPALEGFYVPVSNTLLVLDLNEGFNPDELQQWFSEWKDDGLLFLGFVEKFRWCDTEGQAIADKRLAFGPWEPSAIARLHEGVLNISQRQVRSEDQAWTVWKATVHVPENLHPDHKARSDTTDISIAMPQAAARGTLYIGFKTLVPVSMPFSLDGQFDPSTAREGVIQNDWNEWLIARCGEVVGDVAGHLLATKPRIAWTLIPVNDEHIGKEEDRWLRARFDATFAQMRVEFGESASVLIGEERIPRAESCAALNDALAEQCRRRQAARLRGQGDIALTNVAYEQEALSGLLTPADVEALSSGARALPQKGRDADDRWRIVLNLLDVSKIAGTTELLAGFDHGLFITKDTRWWVDAADRLTGIHPDDELGSTLLAWRRSPGPCMPSSG